MNLVYSARSTNGVISLIVMLLFKGETFSIK